MSMTWRVALAGSLLGLIAGPAEAGLAMHMVGIQSRFPDPATVSVDFGTQIVDPSADFVIASFAGNDILIATVTDTQLV